jgi:predicted ATPase
LILLEDLHWADHGTLDLLVHVARHLSDARLLIVATYRDVEVDRGHPLSAALAELRRVAEVDRMRVRGLIPEEVGRMMTAVTERDVRRSVAEAVHRQTEGNPLFIQEVSKYLVEEGYLRTGDGIRQQAGTMALETSIPHGLRDVIGKRLSRLSADCNRVLTVASVIGREFDYHALLEVVDLAEEVVMDALEEALRAGVIEQRERVGGAQLRFCHAFFRLALYEEISVPRRLRFHQQVGRALETRYAPRLEEHAAELAEHFAHSSEATDLANAARFGELAAQRAMAVNAFGEAARLLARTIEVQEVLDPDSAEGKTRRCELLLSFGEAVGLAGDPTRVYEEVAPAAFAVAESLENRDVDLVSRICDLALDALTR